MVLCPSAKAASNLADEVLPVAPGRTPSIDRVTVYSYCTCTVHLAYSGKTMNAVDHFV
jgi:hypothetical protein